MAILHLWPLVIFKSTSFYSQTCGPAGWDIGDSPCLCPMCGHKGYKEKGWGGGDDALPVLCILAFASALEMS